MNEDARKQIEELFLHYGPGVGSYVLLRVGNSELAEEITARVFLTVVRQFHQQKHSLVGWLWSIVRTELARLARERPHQVYPQELTSAEELPADQLERKELQELLHRALQQLPEEARQLLSMKFFLGLNNQEIAQASGLTPGHVGVKLHRALQELRRRMQPPLPLGAAPTMDQNKP